MKVVEIRNWSVVGSGTPYTAPELMTPRLSGNVYGHPRFDDGCNVVTSRIESVDGRKVTTLNTTYLLGEPSEEYMNFCEKIGKPLDEENPIKFIDRK